MTQTLHIHRHRVDQDHNIYLLSIPAIVFILIIAFYLIFTGGSIRTVEFETREPAIY